MNHKCKKQYIDGRPYKLQMILDEKKQFNTVFLDFAMISNLKEVFFKYGQDYQEKAANTFFSKIKKEFERENPNTLVILNHPVNFNTSSGTVSDFLIELCLYIKTDTWNKTKQDEYMPTMIDLAEKIKEKINRALL